RLRDCRVLSIVLGASDPGTPARCARRQAHNGLGDFDRVLGRLLQTTYARPSSRRVALPNPLSKENRMPTGDTNRGFQNIRFDKNSHQISFGDTNTRVPVRECFEYLGEQGVDERDVLPVWQSGANRNKSNESTGRSGELLTDRRCGATQGGSMEPP